MTSLINRYTPKRVFALLVLGLIAITNARLAIKAADAPGPVSPVSGTNNDALVEVSVVSTNDLRPLAQAAIRWRGVTNYTDTRGLAILRMPGGHFAFWVSRKDWRSGWYPGEIEPGKTNRVRIEMTPSPRIYGIVRDATGMPVSNVLILFHPGYSPRPYPRTETRTDAEGRYQLILQGGPVISSWWGMANNVDFIMARSLGRNLAAMREFEAASTNLDLTLEPGIALSGSLKDSRGAPITYVTVDLAMMSGHFVEKLDEFPINVDERGRFTIPAMPQGRDYILFDGLTAHRRGTDGGLLSANNSRTNHYEFPPFVLNRTDGIWSWDPLAGGPTRR